MEYGYNYLFRVLKLFVGVYSKFMGTTLTILTKSGLVPKYA
jgi:hypothetical protein